VQEFVDGFKRAEKSRELAAQMLRQFACLNEIAVAELAGKRNHSRSHGPIFMGALGPGHAFLCIDPNGKSQDV